MFKAGCSSWIMIFESYQKSKKRLRYIPNFWKNGLAFSVYSGLIKQLKHTIHVSGAQKGSRNQIFRFHFSNPKYRCNSRPVQFWSTWKAQGGWEALFYKTDLELRSSILYKRKMFTTGMHFIKMKSNHSCSKQFRLKIWADSRITPHLKLKARRRLCFRCWETQTLIKSIFIFFKL